MPEQLGKIDETQIDEIGKINPVGAEVPQPIDLTVEENTQLTSLLEQAKQAEKTGKYEIAASSYEEYRDSYKQIRREKISGELKEKLNLQEQYESQIQILREAGVIQELTKTTEGIIDINGVAHLAPSLEDVLDKFTPEKVKNLKEKISQGFKKLLIVPLGMSINELKDLYIKFLVKKNDEGKFISPDGSRLEINDSKPPYEFTLDDSDRAEDKGKLLYFPRHFKRTEHDDGVTKRELIKQGQTWRLELIEDSPILPDDKDIKILGGRKQIPAGLSPEDYLKLIQESEEYRGEKGFTLEDWLTYAITNLAEGRGQIDDNDSGHGCWLIGSRYYMAVPFAVWDKEKKQGCIAAYHANDISYVHSTRTSVEL